MKDSKKRLLALIGLVMSGFIGSLDSTIVNVSLPAIQQSFAVEFQGVMWISTIFLLFNASFLVTLAKLGDMFGRKKLFLISLSVFTISSVLCGISPSLLILIIARAVQGIASAGLMTIAIPIAIGMFSKEKSGMVAGVWGSSMALAMAIGPSLGGFITEKFNWRYIFYINIPLAIISYILVTIFVSKDEMLSNNKKIDFGGILFLSISLFSLTYALLEGNNYGFNSMKILTLFATTIVSTIVLLIIEKRNNNALFDLSLFKIRSFTLSSVTLAFVGVVYAVCGSLINFYLKGILNYTTLQSGNIIAFLSIGFLVSSIIAGILSTKLKFSTLSFIAVIICMGSLYLISTINPNVSVNRLRLYLFLGGVGNGIVGGQLVASALADIPKEKNGQASGVNRMIANIGNLLCLSILSAILISNENYYFNLSKNEMINSIKLESRLNSNVKNDIIVQLQKIDKNNYNKLPEKINSVLKNTSKSKERAYILKNIISKDTKYTRENTSKAFTDTFRISILGLIPALVLSLFVNPKCLYKKKE
ncbi:DHA2 family efflux MFS transporter permease subunit (plasmid) [Clostridium estertheticum]|uniref:DHA2 family efflux MFS transporter permease subunit n=1 Tax=Clostridium estertheticum TaxID=238834 RepID=UPI001C7DBF1F|nr:DHA2 family efflux MFS transporter permease subunit [Clostridium estertheticum]MBX4260467.1 DHA2 family efflux MFS transporter permease subunit [Clostridium estertheticum]WLC72958.1 DHA2 family efflux MFS transporter permease subunit [Clostridium estertheticum]